MQFLTESERGMTPDEVKQQINAPHKINPAKIEQADKHSAIMRLLYDTWARIDEIISADVQDIDMQARFIELKHTKRKVYHTETGYDSIQEPRKVDFSEETRIFLARYLKGRKSGALFIGNSGQRLTGRAVCKMMHNYAVKIGIQRLIKHKNGKTSYLVSPKALREAGEGHAVCIYGMDAKLAAAKAGHTVRVQAKYYTKFDSERAKIASDEIRKKMGTL